MKDTKPPSNLTRYQYFIKEKEHLKIHHSVIIAIATHKKSGKRSPERLNYQENKWFLRRCVVLKECVLYVARRK